MRGKFGKIALVLVASLALTLVLVPPLAAAPEVGMVIGPTPKIVNVGDTFTVDIKVTITGDEAVDSVGAYLDFDTSYLDVVSITPGATLSTVVENDFDNANGTIDYAAGAALGTSPPTTDFVLATVEFSAEAATDGISLTFVFTPITRKTDAFSVGTSLLDASGVVDGRVIIDGEGEPGETPSAPGAPGAPSNPSPANGAANIATSVTLSVLVSDPDGDAMTVTFYDSNNNVIGTAGNVASGARASVTWSGLELGTQYSWYARANDGELDSPKSSTWSFATKGASGGTASGSFSFTWYMAVIILLGVAVVASLVLVVVKRRRY